MDEFREIMEWSHYVVITVEIMGYCLVVRRWFFVDADHPRDQRQEAPIANYYTYAPSQTNYYFGTPPPQAGPPWEGWPPRPPEEIWRG